MNPITLNPMKEATIENFQNHIKTTIQFAPAGQLTVIVGPSRSGKTAIIRALRWLLYNDPAGVSVPDWTKPGVKEEASYCRIGASFMRVTLKMESGHIVIRERTKATNRYKIIVPGEPEPQKFEGFGTSVPLEIQEITGVSPLKIGDRTININLAEQLDPPFLGKKTMSAPERAKILGKLAGTEEIDLAGKRLGTDLFRSNQEEKRLKVSLKETTDKIAGYDYLPGMKDKIVALEVVVATVKKAQERRKALAELKGAYDRAETGALTAMAVIRRWRGIREAEVAVREAEAAAQKKRSIEVLDGNLVRINAGINSAWAVISKLQHLADADDLAKDAEAKSERRQQYHGLRQTHLNLAFKIEHWEITLAHHKGLSEAEEILRVAAKDLERRRQLAALEHQYTLMDSQVQVLKARAEKYRNIDVAEAQVNLAGDAEMELLALLDLKAKHERCLKGEEATRMQVDFYKDQISESEAAYLDELAAMGVCPTCGQSTKKENLKEAI